MVKRLSGIDADRIIPERYRLSTPQSPHLAAAVDGVQIQPELLMPPDTASPLVIEGAGGVLVPLTQTTLYVDVMQRWRLPTIVCARTILGTINHTLLTLEALKRREIPILGVALIGAEHVENARIIESMGAVPVLGRLPRLDPLSPESLREAFGRAFSLLVLRNLYYANAG